MNKMKRILASVAIAGALVGGTLVASTPAQGYALTSVKNVSANGALVRVQLDSGYQRYISPGQTVFGVSWVLPTPGKCYDITPNPDVCYNVGLKLGLGGYTVRAWNY